MDEQQQKNVEVVASLFESFTSGDLDGVLRLLDPAVVLIEADGLPWGGRYEGIAGFQRLVSILYETWTDVVMSDFDYATGGDGVVGMFNFAATSRATGKKVDMRFAEYYRLLNGKITFSQPFYFDTHTIVQAIT